ncbi:MAG: response regulator [Ignavibacteriota bacterium]
MKTAGAGLALGAMTFLEKTVTKDALNAAFDTIHHSLQRRTKKLLMVTGVNDRRAAWMNYLRGPDVEIISVASGGEALAVAKDRYLDGIVIDSHLEDISAIQLVEEIQAEISPQTPPIVVCGDPVAGPIEAEIRRLARQGVVRHAESLDRMLEETTLFLHRAEGDLSEAQREALAALRRKRSHPHRQEGAGGGRRRSQYFRSHDGASNNTILQVVHAENGRAGIEVLLNTKDVDGVLMDIMMPEMDGYETMRAIRQIAEFRSLPIIAVTAKAMKGDRAKCIEAGASDLHHQTGGPGSTLLGAPRVASTQSRTFRLVERRRLGEPG